jgi:D-alanine--poly(phosphoribitol) ligase subunit 1
MQFNVLEYLDKTVNEVPEKVAYANDVYSLSFKDVYDGARAIGTYLYQQGIYKQPVVVFMNKHPKSIVAYFGVIYGGSYYVPIDEEMSKSRIDLIMKNVNPRVIICDEDTLKVVEEMEYSGCLVYNYEEIVKTAIAEDALSYIRQEAIDTDPAYIVYTSGSTGIPKGVIATHRSVIDYIENLSEVLEFSRDTVFGNQSPLYLDACFKEIFPTIKFGATTYIIPKSLFMFPIKLVEFLNEYKVNTICWVVTALTMISSFNVLDKLVPKYLRTIAFGSEVFPIKQFNYWKRALPDATFINLYGPTEATGMSCYYKVEREFEENDVLPIGRPFRNTEILLLDGDNGLVEYGEVGEICIRGTCLTLGYYQDFERTNEVFVQNPLNQLYPEIIYRTGDLGKYNERNELIFISRKDHQVKHMGYRIELGEIEAYVNAIEAVRSACCIYDKEKKALLLYYVGDKETKDIITHLKQLLPRHMIPHRTEQLDNMPLTTNGKIDRVLLKDTISNKKRG